VCIASIPTVAGPTHKSGDSERQQLAAFGATARTAAVFSSSAPASKPAGKPASGSPVRDIEKELGEGTMDDLNAADGWDYKLGGLGSQLPRTLPRADREWG